MKLPNIYRFEISNKGERTAYTVHKEQIATCQYCADTIPFGEEAYFCDLTKRLLCPKCAANAPYCGVEFGRGGQVITEHNDWLCTIKKGGADT